MGKKNKKRNQHSEGGDPGLAAVSSAGTVLPASAPEPPAVASAPPVDAAAPTPPPPAAVAALPATAAEAPCAAPSTPAPTSAPASPLAPTDAGPDNLTGCVVRASWLIIGPGMVVAFGATILIERLPWGSWADIAYLVACAFVLGARRWEERHPSPDAVHVPGGNAPSFRRGFLIASAAGWPLAHLIGGVI